MNKLFKLIIFSLLLSTQIFPQSISRLKAKKEREKRKREKSKVEIVVEDELLESALECIEQSAKTGRIGDGKIFVSSIEKAIRIRTGEKGNEAI